MYSITDLKKGTLVTIDGEVYKVVSYDHTSMGRGGGVVKTKLKNVRSGLTRSKTFKGSEKIEPAEVESISAQFLYSDDVAAHFMRLDTYEQVAMPKDGLSDSIGFMNEGLEVKLLYVNDSLAAVELPIKVELRVTSADPNVKGDSAGSVMKGCQLETGTEVQVPLFIEAGDTIRVDTRTGSYVERA